MEAVVIPAILVKTRQELLDRISRVNGLVREIQLDIMDGVFVPNKTIGLEDLKDLPPARYEFHWMVMEPEKWIEKVPGPHMHLVHVETIRDFAAVEGAVRKAGGSLGLAINPETPLEKLLPYVKSARRVLVMTVRPGYSGQKYIYEMEHKVRKLRGMFPDLDIEVDGGVNNETVPHAYSSGANLLAAASAIFSSEDVKGAIEHLKKRAMAGCSHGAH
ncbi:MAG: ribulose-phosphate 3-epimerase [Candidatus Micrarchaeota archaeon]